MSILTRSLIQLTTPLKKDISELWRLRSKFASALTGSIVELLSRKAIIRFNSEGRIVFDCIKDGRPLKIIQEESIYPFVEFEDLDWTSLSHDQIIFMICSPTFELSKEKHISEYHVSHISSECCYPLASVSFASLVETYKDVISRLKMFRFVDQVWLDLVTVEVLTPLGYRKETLEDRENIGYIHPDHYIHLNPEKDTELEIGRDIHCEGGGATLIKLLKGEPLE